MITLYCAVPKIRDITKPVIPSKAKDLCTLAAPFDPVERLLRCSDFPRELSRDHASVPHVDLSPQVQTPLPSTSEMRTYSVPVPEKFSPARLQIVILRVRAQRGDSASERHLQANL